VPKTGDRFEMVDGSVYEVTTAAADSGGEFVEMLFTLPPGSVSPPPHVHAGLTEEYEVIEGAFEVMSGGAWTTLRPGQSASIPPRRFTRSRIDASHVQESLRRARPSPQCSSAAGPV
jgi:mannose-6-phosphate isomerase-like protein (cupin superfamily)